MHDYLLIFGLSLGNNYLVITKYECLMLNFYDYNYSN